MSLNSLVVGPNMYSLILKTALATTDLNKVDRAVLSFESYSLYGERRHIHVIHIHLRLGKFYRPYFTLFV